MFDLDPVWRYDPKTLLKQSGFENGYYMYGYPAELWNYEENGCMAILPVEDLMGSPMENRYAIVKLYISGGYYTYETPYLNGTFFIKITPRGNQHFICGKYTKKMSDSSPQETGYIYGS